jgi:hypothetical protein
MNTLKLLKFFNISQDVNTLGIILFFTNVEILRHEKNMKPFDFLIFLNFILPKNLTTLKCQTFGGGGNFQLLKIFANYYSCLKFQTGILYMFRIYILLFVNIRFH